MAIRQEPGSHGYEVRLPKAWYLFMAVVLCAAVGGLIWLGIQFLALVLPSPISYPDGAFISQEQPVHPGAPLTLQVHRCYHDLAMVFDRTAPIRITRTLLNVDTGAVRLLDDGITDTRVGCERLSVEIGYLPLDIKPGRYIVYGRVIPLDGFQRKSQEWATTPFEVAE